MQTPYQSGFVNILGKPNAGKSTLMNALMGERLSIISPKAQTTRHRIKGILNGDNYQIVISDTPGILKPSYLLHEKMMGMVNTAAEDADLVLFMIEPRDKEPDEKQKEVLARLKAPCILLVNKIDASNQDELDEVVPLWKEAYPFKEIIPISALHKFNIDVLLKRVLSYLPESPPYFPTDQLTDLPERFFAAEIVREKIFLNYKQEIPYSCEVIVDSFKDSEKIVRILTTIYVARESQKPIVIGKGGSSLKTVGIQARKDLETFFQKQVHLELFVKVKDEWREKPGQLKNFGYDNF